MKVKTKEKLIDGITFVCLCGMIVFAHGYKVWCAAASIGCGLVALFLQNCVKKREKESDEFDF